MKNVVFWDVAQCKSCVNRREQTELSLQPPTQRWFLARGFFYPEGGHDTLHYITLHYITLL
jgi:hypothetical protein